MLRFLKEWTLPVAIALGTLCYLLFYYVPALDAAGKWFGPVFDVIFPFFVFLTLLVTFCKVDFHQMRPHRWHLWVLVAQIVLVAANVGIIFFVGDNMEQKILWEGVLTCVIGPSASAAPVVTGKLGGNISTMTTFTLISSFASALMIPAVFPLLEHEAHITFLQAFFIILEKVAMVLILPLVFYFWGVSLSITTGITVKNIVHSNASLSLLLMIALLSLIMCFIQFGIGRAIGTRFGEKINSGQALFQKNTALSIWVAYMYLNPVASVGAGCYVLWQNIINSAQKYINENVRNGKPPNKVINFVEQSY